MSSLLLVQFKADRCLCVCSKFHIFSSKKEGKPLKHHFPGVYNVNAYAHNFLQLSSYNQWLSISSPPIYTVLWNCCVYPRGRDVRLRNTLPCTVYEVLEYMSVLHETFVTRLTHYPVRPLPRSSGTRRVRITHPARQPGTSGFRYAPSSKRPCTIFSQELRCLKSATWGKKN